MRNWLTALKRFGCMAVPLVAISLNDISAHLADGELSLEEREVALRVKGRETSQLIVDKYYRRFVEVIRNRRQRTPTANESREWLALFKAKQVMIPMPRHWVISGVLKSTRRWCGWSSTC